MKENQVHLFRKLDRPALLVAVQFAETAPDGLAASFKQQYENKLPGEFGFAQLDLTCLLVTGVPAELLAGKVRFAEQRLFGNKLLGRYGKLRTAEDPAAGKDSRPSGQARVVFDSSVQAALTLLVDWL